jgi:hypothetical protein
MLESEVEAQVTSECEALGIAKVREAVAQGRWSGAFRRYAEGWLARCEAELESSDREEMRRTARSAKNAAWAAAIAAIVAAIAAICALFISRSALPPV